MRFISLSTLAAIAIPVAGHCANPELPSNVSLRDEGNRHVYIDTIDFSYQKNQPTDFAKLKLCIAENITNNAVTLQDASGSFVGPSSGIYYHSTQNQTVQGSGIFKYIEDSSSTLIASGTTDGGKTALGLTRYILKFDLKAVVADAAITLRFSNISRAQQNTGSLANDGFQPAGAWRGAKAPQVYASLEVVAGKIKACLQ